MPATTARLRAVRCSVRAGCLVVIWLVTVALLRPAGPRCPARAASTDRSAGRLAWAMRCCGFLWRYPACLLTAFLASVADDIVRKETDVVSKGHMRQNQAMTAR